MSTPPPNAIALFNGKNLSNWTKRDGSPAGWDVKDGLVTVAPRTGDIMTRERYTDFALHLEFRCPDMPDAKGQAKGNSGVFLQGRYEVQALDSYGIEIPGKGDCGAVYDQYAPLVNACRPALEWQSYDICFRAARRVNGEVVDNARLTLLFNGQAIHNNVETFGPTGGAVDMDVDAPGPLLLQDHGNLVSYRNIWILPLPSAGSDKY